jgi:pimeloyl-ACP methyl ester carboxylesterase
MFERLQIRIHGDPSLPTLVYLPGLHGDWTLVSSFRAAISGKVRFVEFTYPQTTEWSLDDHAREIEQALLANGITEGWVIGESFGSQPAWQLIKRACENSTGFQTRGLVLAGGFVRYPIIWGVRLFERVSRRVSLRTVALFCAIYARYAKFRHKHAPESLASIKEFVANRCTEADREAITYRYVLIADNDPRRVARRTTFPVHYLAGSVDPLVPWPHVRWWLRRNCPGYRGGRTIWRADHNVLATAPKKSADQILTWIAGTQSPQRNIKLAHEPEGMSSKLLS